MPSEVRCPRGEDGSERAQHREKSTDGHHPAERQPPGSSSSRHPAPGAAQRFNGHIEQLDNASLQEVSQPRPAVDTRGRPLRVRASVSAGPFQRRQRGLLLPASWMESDRDLSLSGAVSGTAVLDPHAGELELGHYAGRELDPGQAEFAVADRRSVPRAQELEQELLLPLDAAGVGRRLTPRGPPARRAPVGLSVSGAHAGPRIPLPAPRDTYDVRIRRETALRRFI
jgi:hypothetical protein